MGTMHIIILWIIFVLLIAIYFIAKVITKQSRLINSEDFITDFVNKKQNTIVRNDINMSISVYLGIMILCPLIIGIGVYLLGHNIFLAVMFGASSLLIPDAIIMFLKNRENKIFEEKYERSLEQLSSALKAGLSIMQAVKEVSDNKFIYEPLRRRYSKLYV